MLERMWVHFIIQAGELVTFIKWLAYCLVHFKGSVNDALCYSAHVPHQPEGRVALGSWHSLQGGWWLRSWEKNHLAADTHALIPRNLPSQHRSLTQFARPFWDSSSSHTFELGASFFLAGYGWETKGWRGACPDLGALSTSSSLPALPEGLKAVRKGGERVWGTSHGQEGLPSLGTYRSQTLVSSGCLLPQCWGEHARVTALWKLERTFQMYKTLALGFSCRTFWTLEHEVLCQFSQKGIHISQVMLGWRCHTGNCSCKLWVPYSCQEPFCVPKETRGLESDVGWAIPGIDSHGIWLLEAEGVGSE